MCIAFRDFFCLAEIFINSFFSYAIFLLPVLFCYDPEKFCNPDNQPLKKCVVTENNSCNNRLYEKENDTCRRLFMPLVYLYRCCNCLQDVQ